MFKQSSFRSFCDAYNYMFAKDIDRRFRLNNKRLLEVFYCYEILKFFKENNRIQLNCNNNLKYIEYFNHLTNI